MQSADGRREGVDWVGCVKKWIRQPFLLSMRVRQVNKTWRRRKERRCLLYETETTIEKEGRKTSSTNSKNTR
jgi:hypothetical protein